MQETGEKMKKLTQEKQALADKLAAVRATPPPRPERPWCNYLCPIVLLLLLSNAATAGLLWQGGNLAGLTGAIGRVASPASDARAAGLEAELRSVQLKLREATGRAAALERQLGDGSARSEPLEAVDTCGACPACPASGVASSGGGHQQGQNMSHLVDLLAVARENCASEEEDDCSLSLASLDTAMAEVRGDCRCFRPPQACAG